MILPGGNSMDREEFGELIAALREELGWTQAQLAERAGVDTPTTALSSVDQEALQSDLPPTA
jgi:transcriptional regulator with XRE-family HTH domain